MKRFLLPLLCFFILSYTSSADIIEVPESVAGMLIGSGAVGGGEDYSDIVFWLNFEENDTTGDYDMGANEHSEGDTSGAYGGGATLESGSVVAKSGTYSLLIDDADYLEFAVSSNDIVPQSLRIAVWVEITAWNTGDAFFYAYGSNLAFRLREVGTDELEVWYRWAEFQSVTVTTTNANLTAGTNTTYCLEVEIDVTSNDVTIWRDGTELSDGFAWEDDETLLAISGYSSLFVGYGVDGSSDFNIGKVVISNSLSRDIQTDFDETVNYPG